MYRYLRSFSKDAMYIRSLVRPVALCVSWLVELMMPALQVIAVM